MKRIDVVELYVIKRIELLERANGEYQINKKEIAELKEVLDVINRVNFDKQVRDDDELELLSNTLDKIDKCLSKVNED
jgi:hypothetical protein